MESVLKLKLCWFKRIGLKEETGVGGKDVCNCFFENYYKTVYHKSEMIAKVFPNYLKINKKENETQAKWMRWGCSSLTQN